MPVCSGKDGCALGASNVGASMGADFAGDGVHAVAELRGNRTRNRQWPLQRARWRAGAGRRHDLSPALCKAAEQFRPQFFVLRVLQELQVGVLAGDEMIICRHLVGCFVGEFYHNDGFGYFCGSWVAVLVGGVYGSCLRVSAKEKNAGEWSVPLCDFLRFQLRHISVSTMKFQNLSGMALHRFLGPCLFLFHREDRTST